MLIRWLHRLEDTLLVILVVTMLGLALIQIILRNGFDSGIVWGDSLLRVLVLWITLVGAMVASRTGNHIGIDLVARYLNPGLAHAAKVIAQITAALVCAMLAWQSIRFIQLEYQYPITAFGQIPTWICELILPLGFGVMGIRFLILAFSKYRSPGNTPL